MPLTDTTANKLSKLQNNQGKGFIGKAARFIGRNPRLSMLGSAAALGLGGLAMYRKFSPSNKNVTN